MGEQQNGGSSVSPASVGLNVGTLVVIAIIVFFFSGSREPDYARQLRADIKKQAEAQQAELESIRKLLDERLPATPSPGER